MILIAATSPMADVSAHVIFPCRIAGALTPEDHNTANAGINCRNEQRALQFVLSDDSAKRKSARAALL